MPFPQRDLHLRSMDGGMLKQLRSALHEEPPVPAPTPLPPSPPAAGASGAAG
jgi:hypothetical protein